MFAYIYADGRYRGIGQFIVSKSEAKVNNSAILCISELLVSSGINKSSQAYLAVDKAIASGIAADAITAWNTYARDELKIPVARHSLNKIDLVV